MSKLSQEIEGLNRQNVEKEKPASVLAKHDPMVNQDLTLQMVQLKAASDEKDKIIHVGIAETVQVLAHWNALYLCPH